MRVTGTHHGNARRVDESRWLLLPLGDANQICSGVHIHPSRDFGYRVDRRRDDRREMDDRVRGDLGDETLHLLGIGEVGPPELDPVR